MYTDDMLSMLLDSYWELYEGILVLRFNSVREHTSPHENCAIFKADIDSAMCALTDDARWRDVVEAMDSYHSYGWDPRDLFEDAPKYYRMLNKHQKAVFNYHLSREKDMSEWDNAFKARVIMRRYLNHRTTPKEWRLVGKLVKLLT